MCKQFFAIFVVLVSLSPAILYAEHREVSKDGQKVDGTVVYKANYISPDDSDGFISHDLNSYFLIEEKLGLGVDTSFCPESDFFKVNPFASWSIGNGFSLVGGLSMNSLDADYVDAGIWYFGSLTESMNIFVDLRYYLETNDKAEGYFDSFAEISYPVNDDFTLALNLIYDRWEGSGNNWALVGPVVYWHITESTTIFTRIAREMDFDGGGSTDFRVAVKWAF